MQRYNTISCIPGIMKPIDYEDKPYSSDKPSVVDMKYFIPLSQQSSGIFRAFNPESFTFKDGVDDGRDPSLRRRGLDLAQKTTTLRAEAEKLASARRDVENRLAEHKALSKASKASKEGD